MIELSARDRPYRQGQSTVTMYWYLHYPDLTWWQGLLYSLIQTASLPGTKWPTRPRW